MFFGAPDGGVQETRIEPPGCGAASTPVGAPGGSGAGVVGGVGVVAGVVAGVVGVVGGVGVDVPSVGVSLGVPGVPGVVGMPGDVLFPYGREGTPRPGVRRVTGPEGPLPG